MSINTAINLVMVACMLVAGWAIRGWYEDAQDKAAMEAQLQTEEKFRAEESAVAKLVEQRLADLKANERVIEREVLKLVDRPVYRSDCIDDDGLRLLGDMARGRRAAEPAGKVP